jgi:chromosome segregation ATPase
MSSITYQNRVNSISKEIQRLEAKRADFSKQIAAKKKSAITLSSSLRNAKGSSLTSKLNQINRLENEVANIEGKRAEVEKQISRKTVDLNNANIMLQKELAKEAKKQQEDAQKDQKKIQDNYNRQIRKLQEELTAKVSAQTKRISHQEIMNQDNLQYDVFVSHASEDKETFVKPFVEELKKLGITVWYDNDVIKWGDSIRKKIDEGLRNSKFGIVVISSDFVKKYWTNHELDGLFNLEESGESRILPIWHNISKSEVMKFSPSLAAKMALSTALMTPEEISKEVLTILHG